MARLSNDEFFAKLVQLFDSRKGKDHGSIFLTQKRLSHDQPLPEATSDTIFPDLHPPQPMPVLVRATNGKSKDRRKEKVKLSTVVDADALPAFFERYADVCKAGMTTLKPRDRSKRKGKAKKKKAAGGGGGS
ncbi:putative signal recognition particle 14kd protein [Eutypa lata UCREL1]|uniref:Signal recognition particle subunit SRP14 n=1 Tax=Eutypa lata (strain UCR-EL1) TaxID=1287681 RepID=M7SA85_EUTLA|nr:putative signal recognition particle 14kd protein [Eutypa lata UCREL1]